jgi:hypothetical protein
LEQVTQ